MVQHGIWNVFLLRIARMSCYLYRRRFSVLIRDVSWEDAQTPQIRAARLAANLPISGKSFSHLQTLFLYSNAHDIHLATSSHSIPHPTPRIMAGKMDVDAVNGEKEGERVGPAADLPPERSTSSMQPPKLVTS